MPFPYPQMAVEGLGGPAADRQRPRSPARAQHPHDPPVQVDIVPGHADALGPAHAGVDQEQNGGGVAAAGEVAPLAGPEQPGQVPRPDHLDRLLGGCGGRMPSMGLAWRSPSATAHLEKACRPR
jgi:hypothetical protein